MKKVLTIILSATLLLGLFGCTAEKSRVEYLRPATDIDFTEPEVPEEPLDPEIQALLEKSSLSEKERYQIMGYSHRTAEGICFYRQVEDTGYLAFTLSNVRYLGEGDIWPQDNYEYEAYLELDEKNNWVKRDRPAHLNADGTSKPGWNMVLIDVTVTSHNAVSRLGVYSDYDPYLFSVYCVCDLADIRYMSQYGCKTLGLDYFSEMGKYPEDDRFFRLEPGESIHFTVGFLLPPRSQGGMDPFEYLRICNTSGNPNSVFLRLDEEGLAPCD